LDQGGAANSCIRLHLALLDLGVESKLLVLEKKAGIYKSYGYYSQSLKSKAVEVLKKIGFKIGLCNHPYLGSKEKQRRNLKKQFFTDFEYFSTPFSDFKLTQSKLFREADIIHLHWVAGFLNYSEFFSNTTKPIVWTLHDMAPFNGGYHYLGFQQNLNSIGEPMPLNFPDKSRMVLENFLKEKLHSLKNFSNLTIVSPSRWLLDLSKKSDLFFKYSHHHIPYGLPKEVFYHKNSAEMRLELGIPLNKRILLFVSDSLSNPRKGMHLLLKALEEYPASSDVELCCVGKIGNFENLGNARFFGRIYDPTKLASIYCAADLFVIPSLEDNLPNTVLESLMCGTPVLGFSIGGIPEMVIPGINGFLAEQVSVDGLSKALLHAFGKLNQLDRKAISENAIEKYASEIQSTNYFELYQSLLN
jgi:glycosyltransferase involved in cell wall biosynthesis